MNLENISVKRWISEENEKLSELVTDAITNKSRVHIKAPVHTGKTTFAINQIEKRRKDHQILVLAPQIAITNLIFNELEKKGVQSFIFNSETKGEFTKKDIDQPILCTFDSAHLFFDGNFEHQLDPTKVFVIIDETHAFIQNGKEDYDKTVRAILDVGCPVIGFSATPSAWVIEHLLLVDESIEIEVTDLKAKEILSVEIEKSLNASVAHAIKIEGFKKVVVFVSNVTDQEHIEKGIQSLLPGMKVLILNRPSRITDEKSSWDYLLKNEKLPADTEILLMNKVAQAGININDDDIDAVFLVGNFDPIGFLQYLGRCRNYEKEYYYLYGNYGKKEVKIEGSEEHAQYQKIMQQAINLFAKAENLDADDIKGLFGDLYTESAEGKIILNKCMLAKSKYDNYKDLRGDVLVDFMKKFDPTLILGGEYIFEGIDASMNQNKQHMRRKNLKKDVAKALAKNATYIIPMLKLMNKNLSSLSYGEIAVIVSDSKNKKLEAKKQKVLHLPLVNKKSITKMLANAKDAGIGVPKLLVAAKKYNDNNSDPKFIDDVFKMSNAKIVRTVKAYLFYEQNTGSKKYLKKILDEVEKRKGGKETAEQWKTWIKSKTPGLHGSDYLTDNVYDCCCIMKAVQVQKNGKKMKRRRLEKVVRTYKDYVKENNLDNVF